MRALLTGGLSTETRIARPWVISRVCCDVRKMRAKAVFEGMVFLNYLYHPCSLLRHWFLAVYLPSAWCAHRMYLIASR